MNAARRAVRRRRKFRADPNARQYEAVRRTIDELLDAKRNAAAVHPTIGTTCTDAALASTKLDPRLVDNERDATPSVNVPYADAPLERRR
jgi:hypothetical protein